MSETLPANAVQGEPCITITRAEARVEQKAPADWFTGEVRVTPLFSPREPARTSAASVTFPPGARSAWHTHPLGQTLVVTAGTGRVQQWGGPVEVFHVGDVVWIAPGIKHWHGAGPNSPMTHLAIQECVDGSPVQWLEHVSDAQYNAAVLSVPALISATKD